MSSMYAERLFSRAPTGARRTLARVALLVLALLVLTPSGFP
jgi:hypothetical protein